MTRYDYSVNCEPEVLIGGFRLLHTITAGRSAPRHTGERGPALEIRIPQPRLLEISLFKILLSLNVTTYLSSFLHFFTCTIMNIDLHLPS